MDKKIIIDKTYFKQEGESDSGMNPEELGGMLISLMLQEKDRMEKESSLRDSILFSGKGRGEGGESFEEKEAKRIEEIIRDFQKDSRINIIRKFRF